MIFSQKADENVATLIKAVDQVQKNHPKLGTLFVGIEGVKGADLQKLQDTHKLITPLTIAIENEGIENYALNKAAAVTVLIYKRGGDVHRNFAFSDTRSAAAKATDIAAAAKELFK